MTWVEKAEMAPRVAALITGTLGVPKIRHYVGLPPEISGVPDSRVMHPHARVVYIEQTEEGFFLFRLADDGSDAGDTWHQSLEDAKHQAEFEFEDALGPWFGLTPGEDPADR